MKPTTIFHTFRPPIFSIFGTHRPQPIFLRPTFRPPINKPLPQSKPPIASTSAQISPNHSPSNNIPSITQFKPFSAIPTTTRNPVFMHPPSSSNLGTTQSFPTMVTPLTTTPSISSSSKTVTSTTTTTTTPKPVLSIGSSSPIKPNNRPITEGNN